MACALHDLQERELFDMNEPIVFITKSWHHHTAAMEFLQKYNIELPVYYASDAIEGVEMARQQIENGTKVLISTDYLCDRFMENFNIPVVPIKRNSYSFCVRIQEALKQYDRVAILCRAGTATFTLAAQEAQSLYPERTVLYYFNQSDKTLEMAQRIKAAGFQVMLGPSWIREVAIQVGLEFLNIPLPEIPFLDAIAQARHNLKIYRQRIENERLINAILNTTEEAIVATDRNGHILNINQSACNFFDVQSESLIGHHYQKTPLSGLNLSASLKRGQGVNGDVTSFRDQQFMYSTSPIYSEGKLSALIVKCTLVEKLHEAERKVRMKLLAHGNTPVKSFRSIVGHSEAITKTIDMAKRYAAVDSTVLISAPSGCGKEVFAQSMHNASSRSAKPFTVINCAALPEGILESLLFGYEAGTFTGARTTGKAGLFELAHTGTVFLDEISEMPLTMQGRFLRVLQEREVLRIGSDRPIPVDIRIIAATNRNLIQMIQDGTFREDLYYRISVLLLKIPALAQRIEDVAPLTHYFLATRSAEMKRAVPTVTPEALNFLCAQQYNGNVRQLNNILERAMVLSSDNTIDLDLVRLSFGSPPEELVAKKAGNKPLHQVQTEQEKALILDALKTCSGNRAQSAAMLGISTTTLWRKMRAMGIGKDSPHN